MSKFVEIRALVDPEAINIPIDAVLRLNEYSYFKGQEYCTFGFEVLGYLDRHSPWLEHLEDFKGI